ncbi:Highly reducing polyketide synthase gloL [Cladobotryum mycophilum]|uniref:Highly reducing polyketide synthase gloL n=1 Tax=Cladobotryum mycophilum TaxID=491253 RepID=A0ABR0SHC7_9HYPO
MAEKRDLPEPIAIVGIGLKLPGGVSTPEEFWDLLINKRDGRCRVPADRYNVDGFSGEGFQGVANEHGYFLQDVNLRAFDSSFFSAIRSEMETVDPQQRLLLEVIWECLESAGQTRLRGSDTGVYVGVYGEDWHDLLHKDDETRGSYRISSGSDFIIANRLSYEFDLRGPSMTVRTACSASLTALHLACQSIQHGDCSAAIVAGSSLILSPTMTLDMTEKGVLSPTGSCKTFDAGADGFARGEGINAIFIKPLRDALRDHDPIRAVIRSTGINADGKTGNIGQPNTKSQEALIRHTYEIAGIADFQQTAFVECHGTGTPVGDPLEVAAVANVFGDHGVYIGSVKPNMGHTEGASGLTSVIKAILALEHETIPPNINFSIPNPKIPFERRGLKVPVEATPWPKDRHARISINSFGIGGANAHAIIDSAASFGCPPPGPRVVANGESTKLAVLNGHHDTKANGTPNGHNGSAATSAGNGIDKESVKPWPRLIPISASNTKSLEIRAKNLQAYVESNHGCLESLAHTMGTRRVHLRHRTFCVATDGGPLEFAAITKAAATNNPEIAFVFTGQGAQWAGMGRELMQDVPSFRQDIQEMDTKLQSLIEPPTWLIEEILCSNNEADFINKAEISQPLCTAIQIAIVNFLSKCGVKPSAVVGHSSGEIAAAYAAGSLTKDEAIICAYLRGLMVKTHYTRKGSMAAVGMSREAISPYLMNGVKVACENSLKSVTISGDTKALEQTLEVIKAQDPDTFARKLRVDVAYHSHHMSDIGGHYEESLKPHLQSGESSATVPFYSSVAGRQVPSKLQLGGSYWRSNLESTVLFYDASKALLEDRKGHTTFLEIGPHSALQGSLQQTFQSRSNRESLTYVSTMQRNGDSTNALLSALGQLYMYGFSVDFTFINPSATILTDLPSYPWNHDLELWNESRLSTDWRFRKHAHHEILGSRLLGSSDVEPAWRNLLSLAEVPWLEDHKVMTDVIFPIAGYIAMIGEAIRQITGFKAYTLRKIVVKSALVLQGSGTTEIMTTMKPSRLTNYTNSSWYEFAISSYDGTSWIQHCVGQGKAIEGDVNMPLTRTISSLPRKVPAELLYGQMQKIGLNYGLHFQGLSEITADTKKTLVVAGVKKEDHRQYAAHPVTIDLCMQLCAVAHSKGVARHINSLRLPSSIERIHVHPGDAALAEAATHPHPMGGPQAEATAVTAENKPVIRIENLATRSLDTAAQATEAQISNAARLQWRPVIDFLDPNDLIKPAHGKRDTMLALERLAALCILHTLDTIDSLEVSSTYLTKYVSWLKNEKKKMALGHWKSFPQEAKEWATSDQPSQTALLQSLRDELDIAGDDEASKIAEILCKMADEGNVQGIFSGKLNASSVVGDCLHNLHSLGASLIKVDDFFSLCSHSQPTLRVLELGAGTGSMTEIVLKSLISTEGAPMYSVYDSTDCNSQHFDRAKERLQQYSAVNFKTLDILKDPAEQGFELGSYDLVVASNVFHSTSVIGETLQNIRSLLRPNGRLFLQELAYPSNWKFFQFIMGHTSEWSLDDNESHIEEPLACGEQWDLEFRNAGFSGAEAAVLDDEQQYSLMINIVSTAKGTSKVATAVTFLYHKKRSEAALQLAAVFEQKGIAVDWSEINSREQIPNQDVISTLDLEAPFFRDIKQEGYADLMNYLSYYEGDLLWLTGASQVHCKDPHFGLILGISRSVRLQASRDIWTTELMCVDSTTAAAVLDIFQKFHNRPPLLSDQCVDKELAVHNGIIHVPRYHWISVPEEVAPRVEKDDGPKQMTVGQYGAIDSLHWVQHSSTALQPDEVEISIRCAGVNFRDIMITMGIMEDPKDSLGFECSGVVSRIGSAISHVAVGDHVVASGSGLFATKKVVPGHVVLPMPEGLSFEGAASMLTIYCTAIHAIMNLGQLRKGQSILIHSACGGVGLAAIQICKMIGAEIYATVGNEEKTQFLIDNHNLPRERIFNSRSISFLEKTLEATNGRGVDIVLNSLSGELLHASWSCVAKYGKMMEIGKRDILESGHLALNPFIDNRSFYGIDLSGFLRDRPDEMLKLSEQMLQYYRDGHIKPISPIHVFPMHQLQDAFHYMQRGKHIGKIVLSIPEDSQDIPASKATQSLGLSDAATYLLVGGLGGLGKSIATWMIEQGARSLVFLSRSAGKSTQDQDFLRELESQGCRAVALAGDVTKLADIEKAIKMAPTPITGVIQMSMVLRDFSLSPTSYDDWNAVLNPKVQGTWNLHQAFGAKLDFFVLFSSLLGTFGHTNEMNYSSANIFLNAFAQYRHGQNLPCSVIEIGAIEAVGFVSQHPGSLKHYRSLSLHMVQEQELMDAIYISIKNSLSATTPTRGPYGGYMNHSQLAIGLGSTKSLSDPNNLNPIKRDIRMDMYRQLASGNQQAVESKDRDLREFLKSVVADKEALHDPSTLDFLTLELGRVLCNVLLVPEEDMSSEVKLSAIGVDSLVGIEIRNWFRRTTGGDISILRIMNAETVRGLSELMIAMVEEKRDTFGRGSA